MLRIALETSITRFVGTGLAVYAERLAHALREVDERIEVIPCAIPAAFSHAPNRIVQKMYAAYWQIVHARLILPLRIKHLHCDLVHYTVPLPIPARMPSPIVATVHDLIPFVHPEWVPRIRGQRMRDNIRQTIARAQHMLTDSEATRYDLLAHFASSPAPVTTVPLGADTQLPPLNDSQAQQLVASKFRLAPGYILCVGAIEPRKNLERVIEAFSMLAQQSTPPQLVIVGHNAWRHERLAALIDRQQLRSRITFTGHIPAQQLAALFRCAGVFVYPSLYEGFGIPPLEAMNCDCPVITSTTSSLPEVVGDAALLVDPYNTTELAAAIERVLHDRDLARQLRERGRQRARLFTWRRCATETIAVYRRALEA